MTRVVVARTILSWARPSLTHQAEYERYLKLGGAVGATDGCSMRGSMSAVHDIDELCVSST